jgi:hypothetical protein
MALTHGDKAECKEIARVIVKEVITEHIKSCPHGKAMLANKWLVIGIGLVSGLGSGGLVAVLMRMGGG